METWRDIKTAPTEKPILVTDGNSVWFGRFFTYHPDFPEIVFEGTNLSSGSSAFLRPDDLTEWQPAPGTIQEPEKTANEMFRELEYKESEFEDVYINDKEIRICVSNRTEIAKWTYDKFGETVWVAFTPEEILACAKLIKEMEVKGNG